MKKIIKWLLTNILQKTCILFVLTIMFNMIDNYRDDNLFNYITMYSFGVTVLYVFIWLIFSIISSIKRD